MVFLKSKNFLFHLLAVNFSVFALPFLDRLFSFNVNLNSNLVLIGLLICATQLKLEFDGQLYRLFQSYSNMKWDIIF